MNRFSARVLLLIFPSLWGCPLWAQSPAPHVQAAKAHSKSSAAKVAPIVRQQLFGSIRGGALILAGAVVFVLLIACANVANLLLARGSRRGRELAIHAALGASRRQLAELGAESLLLSLAGAILGDIATGWIPPGIPGFEEAGGLKQNTDLDYLANPAGDPAVAAKYMNLAAKEGVPVKNGKYAGTQKLLTIATNADPGKKTAEVAQGQLQNLGFQLLQTAGQF